MAKEKAEASIGEQLMDLVGKAKPEDLAALDAVIEGKEKEVSSLRSVRKVLAISLGVEEEKKKGGRKKPAASPGASPTAAGQPSASPPTGSTEERRNKCVRYIAKNGPTARGELMALFGIPQGSGGIVFDPEVFERTAAGLMGLSAKGGDLNRRLVASGPAV